MTKALIIASCGLIVALIIGATSYSESQKKPHEQPLIDHKCTDAVEPRAMPKGCATLGNLKNAHAEIFMRQIKRKARVAFA